ncbi:MAG: hypothetical protein EOP87_03870 [Verrucomicrobiaceae bacterium]|nr:MAG: hypothetical protein EOP87_03870 [Verrucomicrobiaceae bacterium]
MSADSREGANEEKPYGFTAHYLIRSSPSRCWEHWTDDARLTEWLATRAAVDCRAGGDYLISSRLPLQSGRHRVEEVRENSHLSLTWFINGYPTRLNVGFESHKDGVMLSVEQLAGHDEPPGIYFGYDPGQMSFQKQSWDYAISRLRGLLEDGAAGLGVPENDVHDEINFAVEIAASPQAVFSALTDLPELRKWERMCGENGVIEKNAGGRYSFGWEAEVEGGDGPGQIEEYVEGNRLVYSWFGESPATVSWQMAGIGEGSTLLEFRHAKMPLSSYAVWEYKLGWSSSLFALKWYLERGERCGAWMGEM